MKKLSQNSCLVREIAGNVLNSFNAEVRPYLTEIPIGKQGIGFDRLDLDAWVEDYKNRNGRPGKRKGVDKPWDARKSLVSSTGKGYGTSTKLSEEEEFAKALERATSKKRKVFSAQNGADQEAEVYGVRPKRTFRQAATKYLNEASKKSLAKDAWSLKRIDPFIGGLHLENVHMGTLRPYIEHAQRMGWKNRTINMPMEVVRHISNLACGRVARRTWSHVARVSSQDPLAASVRCERPYPLSWDRAAKLFDALPEHLRVMCLFAVNTGCRDREMCGSALGGRGASPRTEHQRFHHSQRESQESGGSRLWILNRVAREVIDRGARRSSRVGVHLQGARHPNHEQYGLEGHAEGSRLDVRANSRSQAYFRSAAAFGGGDPSRIGKTSSGTSRGGSRLIIPRRS